MSNLLSDAERAEMAALTRETGLSETTVKVLSATFGAEDEYGRRTVTHPDPATVPAVGGRIVTRSAREVLDGAWVEVSTLEARLPHTVAVDKGDRLLDVTTGELYEVGAVTTKNSAVGVLWQVAELTRVEGSVL